MTGDGSQFHSQNDRARRFLGHSRSFDDQDLFVDEVDELEEPAADAFVPVNEGVLLAVNGEGAAGAGVEAGAALVESDVAGAFAVSVPAAGLSEVSLPPVFILSE